MAARAGSGSTLLVREGGGKHNNGTIADATGGTTSDFYWIRSLPDTRITPQMFGIVDDFDGSTGTDNSAACQAAADACDALIDQSASLFIQP